MKNCNSLILKKIIVSILLISISIAISASNKLDSILDKITTAQHIQVQFMQTTFYKETNKRIVVNVDFNKNGNDWSLYYRKPEYTRLVYKDNQLSIEKHGKRFQQESNEQDPFNLLLNKIRGYLHKNKVQGINGNCFIINDVESYKEVRIITTKNSIKTIKLTGNNSSYILYEIKKIAYKNARIREHL